jgi:hypothetical protein
MTCENNQQTHLSSHYHYKQEQQSNRATEQQSNRTTEQQNNNKTTID